MGRMYMMCKGLEGKEKGRGFLQSVHGKRESVTLPPGAGGGGVCGAALHHGSP